MKPTLLLLAAGMGSRYGGLKQLDGLGPNGETIMDYSIYDAIQAGFGKIVFVIRKASKISSVRRFFQSMRVIFLQNFASRHWMISQRDSLYQKVVRNHGVQTMLF